MFCLKEDILLNDFGGFNYELQTVKSVLFVCDLL